MKSHLAKAGARAALALVLVPAATCARAQAPAQAPAQPPADALSLGQAVALAMARSPDLEASLHAVRAADARIVQANLQQNPELSVELENFAGSGAVRGVDTLETTLLLSHVLDLGSRRERRTTVARAERDGLDLERQARQLDVVAEVARRFIAVVEAQEQFALSRSAEALANQTLQATSARVAAARAPEAERSRAAITRARSRLDRERAERAVTAAKRQLSALWGEAQAGFTAVADLHALPSVRPFAELAAELQRNPDVLRLATGTRLREAELALAQAQARPNLAFSAGVRRREESDDVALVAGFSLPLQLADRNQGAIAEAAARASQGEAERRATLLRLEASLYALHSELTAASAEASVIRDEIIPLAEQAQAQTQYGFERGRFSWLDLANAQRELMDARRSAIASAATAHRLLAEIERLTAAPAAEADRSIP